MARPPASCGDPLRLRARHARADIVPLCRGFSKQLVGLGRMHRMLAPMTQRRPTLIRARWAIRLEPLFLGGAEIRSNTVLELRQLEPSERELIRVYCFLHPPPKFLPRKGRVLGDWSDEALSPLKERVRPCSWIGFAKECRPRTWRYQSGAGLDHEVIVRSQLL